MPNKKNGGIPPMPYDNRVKLVSAGCGNCIECRKQKSNSWRIRLMEEIKLNKNGKFVTLTFSEEALTKIKNDTLLTDDNDIATYAVRHFLENWRKKTKKSLRHWLITEKGHKNTKRIHLHGLLFSDDIDLIKNKWFYGWVYIGEYVNQETINYIVKYVTKVDTVNLFFVGKILSSPGIGSNYKGTINKFNDKNTYESYKTYTGYDLPLPTYYRNKVYSEIEREKLWLQKLDNKVRYVCGLKIDISTPEGFNNYINALKDARLRNKRLGYSELKINDKKYFEQSWGLNNNDYTCTNKTESTCTPFILNATTEAVTQSEASSMKQTLSATPLKISQYQRELMKLPLPTHLNSEKSFLY